MKSIVDLGCDIADIHHQYTTVHSSLFGASSYRLAIAAVTGRTVKTYQEYLHTLDKLQSRLPDLTAEIPTADAGTLTHQAMQLRDALSNYSSTLHSAIVSLHDICNRLLQDEDSYRSIPPGGHSAFNQDKIHYDRILLQLDKLGRTLNRLFSRY